MRTRKFASEIYWPFKEWNQEAWHEYASISYPMNMSQYHIDKIFRKYLDIPETDPRTGKRITIEKSDAKKFKFGSV